MSKLIDAPDTTVNVRQAFGIDIDMEVPAYSEPNDWTPAHDPAYHFDPPTTRALLLGLAHNRRVLLQGKHGTGKSTHIEQVCARLNWGCVRVNLDSHVSRMDLLGKDAIKLQDGKQITQFQEGILPFCFQRPLVLVFDEYDAGRPDVMFVIQRVLEVSGKLTLLDQSRVLEPHPWFRIFATANTIGVGDITGLYHGTQQINQGQIDRWHIVSVLEYLQPEVEAAWITDKLEHAKLPVEADTLAQMIACANMLRNAFTDGSISAPMSPRAVLTWAENNALIGDVNTSFELSFINKCEPSERLAIAECYQRAFGDEHSVVGDHRNEQKAARDRAGGWPER